MVTNLLQEDNLRQALLIIIDIEDEEDSTRTIEEEDISQEAGGSDVMASGA